MEYKPGHLVFPDSDDESTELWADLDEGYQISNGGKVRRKLKNEYKNLKTYPKYDGYIACKVKWRGTYKSRLVHVIVANLFLGPPDLRNWKTQVDHKNGRRNDNRVENLRWVTPKENAANRFFGIKACPLCGFDLRPDNYESIEYYNSLPKGTYPLND